MQKKAKKASAAEIIINKSAGDKNDYQYFKLKNDLQVLLVEDNNATLGKGEPMAYVSLSVNVGSLNSPPHRQGLAHFLEHMVFMGSKKYPDESSYTEHISANGGFDNACTEFEWTNFHYEINETGLLHSLEMLSACMEESLLSKDLMEREINAV